MSKLSYTRNFVVKMLFVKRTNSSVAAFYFWLLGLLWSTGLGAGSATSRENAAIAYVSHPGIQYSRSINDSGWRSASSVFECSLEQTIPYFGDVIFRKRAGEASSFYVLALDTRFAAGKGEIKVQSPLWKSSSSEKTLATIPMKQGRRPLWLKSKETEQMLAHLNGGQQIRIAQKAWFAEKGSEPASVSISNIGFRQEYRKYLACITGLLPVNYDQVKRSALYFPDGKRDALPAKARRKLDNILLLVERDESIRSFYIDGHTDSNGSRADNLALSKLRAEQVSAYLTGKGIAQERIKTRWHGERYPVASNDSKSGRAKNRRVTVRLEKTEQSASATQKMAKQGMANKTEAGQKAVSENAEEQKK